MSGRKPGAKPDAFRLLMPQSNTFVNHYTGLNVCNTAIQEAIEKSFRRKLSACQRSKVPEDVLTTVLTQPHLSRLEHAHDVLLDEDKRAELNMCLKGEIEKPKEEINAVDSYPLEQRFSIFGAAMHVGSAQPPPKDNWNAVLPQDSLWDIWAKLGVDLRSVQAATVYVALLIYRLDEWGAKDDRIPGSRRNDEQPRSSSDYWKARSLLLRIAGHYATLFLSWRKLYTTARDNDPFRIHARMRIAIEQLQRLQRLLANTQVHLDTLQRYSHRNVENFIWTRHATDISRYAAGECRVWRVMEDLSKFGELMPLLIVAILADQSCTLRFGGTLTRLVRTHEHQTA